MRTKRITLFYQITQKAIEPPTVKEIERKDAWIKEVQGTVEADWKPMFIKVVYELFNPEIGKIQKFFHVAVKWYAIQDLDMNEGEPSSQVLKQYREDLLDDLLGYDYKAVMKARQGEKSRKRKSTTDLKSTQAWSRLMQTMEETEFDAAGYEFPDSEEFWSLTKEHGYDKAQRISISQLQARMKKRI